MIIEKFNNPLYSNPSYQIKMRDENLEEIALCFKEQYPKHIASIINSVTHIELQIILIGIKFKDLRG